MGDIQALSWDIQSNTEKEMIGELMKTSHRINSKWEICLNELNLNVGRFVSLNDFKKNLLKKPEKTPHPNTCAKFIKHLQIIGVITYRNHGQGRKIDFGVNRTITLEDLGNYINKSTNAKKTVWHKTYKHRHTVKANIDPLLETFLPAVKKHIRDVLMDVMEYVDKKIDEYK